MVEDDVRGVGRVVEGRAARGAAGVEAGGLLEGVDVGEGRVLGGLLVAAEGEVEREAVGLERLAADLDLVLGLGKGAGGPERAKGKLELS